MRRARPGDAAAIRALTREAYAKWIPLIGREPFPMTADYDKAVRNHWIDLVEEDGKLIALVEMIPNRDHLFIENLAVSETAQGAGLGSKLLAHVESLARANGLAEVQLATNKAFAANLDFYAKRGYEAYEARPLSDGGTMLRFRKRVSQSA